MRENIYFTDKPTVTVNVEFTGATWVASSLKGPIPMPTTEMLVYKAAHGGNKNDLMLAKLNMILRLPRYRCNGQRARCWE
jgi:hypothetical protein